MQRFGHFRLEVPEIANGRFEYSYSARLMKVPAARSPARNPPAAARMTHPEVARRPGNAARRS